MLIPAPHPQHTWHRILVMHVRNNKERGWEGCQWGNPPRVGWPTPHPPTHRNSRRDAQCTAHVYSTNSRNSCKKLVTNCSLSIWHLFRVVPLLLWGWDIPCSLGPAAVRQILLRCYWQPVGLLLLVCLLGSRLIFLVGLLLLLLLRLRATTNCPPHPGQGTPSTCLILMPRFKQFSSAPTSKIPISCFGQLL